MAKTLKFISHVVPERDPSTELPEVGHQESSET